MKFEEITVFGATGLIGGLLLKLLIDDSDFERIKVVSRKPLLLNDKKIINKIIDFSNYESLSKTVKNSKMVFSAIGTTQSKVNGEVYINLLPFRFELDGIKSPNDLMNDDFGSYGEINKSWSADEAKGFIKISSISNKIYYQTNIKDKK